MKTIHTRSHAINLLFPLIILLIFALSAVTVVLFSAKAYQHAVTQSEQNFTARTSAAYIREKAHRCDTDGGITTGKFHGKQALILEETADGRQYRTYIYENGGKLMELFAGRNVTASLTAGTEIMPLNKFTVKRVSDHLIRFSCTDTDGNTVTDYLSVRSTDGE